MSTEIQSIIQVARHLNPDQRRELAASLALIDADPVNSSDRHQLVHSIKGKYRHLATSSAAFLRRKAEDTAWEPKR